MNFIFLILLIMSTLGLVSFILFFTTCPPKATRLSDKFEHRIPKKKLKIIDDNMDDKLKERVNHSLKKQVANQLKTQHNLSNHKMFENPLPALTQAPSAISTQIPSAIRKNMVPLQDLLH